MKQQIQILYPIFPGLLVFLLWCGGCTAEKKPSFDREAYVKEISAWQEKRAGRISAEDGWLSLAGLFWLKDGENTFGSDSSNVIILPNSVPPFAGKLQFAQGSVRLTAPKKAGVLVNGQPSTEARLLSDADSSSPTLVAIGPVSFYVIKRADKMGVRVKDKQNPARLNFAGLQFFPIDEQWRVEGKYRKFDQPRKMPIATMIGTVDTFLCPGEVQFVIGKDTLALTAMSETGSENQLYFMFSDETRKDATYGGGRQLYTPLPDSTGSVVMDFNKAINWPCAYTPFATCPISPSQNHLSVRVEAGEMNYPGHQEH